MLKCSIVIPSLRPAVLNSCIKSIMKSVGVTYEILVDTEPGGKYKAVSRIMNKISGEYVLHIPDDVLLKPDSIKRMIDFCGDGFVLGSFRTFSKKWNVEDGPSIIYGLEYSRFPFIKTSFIDRVGGLMDTVFSSFYGDPDLSLRVWSAGGVVKTCPDAWLIGVEEEDLVHSSSKKQYERKDKEAFESRWN